MRKKNLALICMFLLSVTFLVSLASAEIIISQPNALYSLGDELSFQVTLSKLGIGYMDVSLVCPGSTENLYHNVPDSTKTTIKRKLTQDYIGNLYGACRISTSYDGETKESQSFEISRSIDITLQTGELTCDAGKTFQIKGTAYRKNNQLAGQIYKTFIEASLPGNATASGIVKDGQFILDFLVPENHHAGRKTVNIQVYDKDDNGNVLNFGNATLQLNVVQYPAKIGIAADKVLVNPGENITIIPFLYDKAGDTMASQINIKIIDSAGQVAYEDIVTSNENFIFQTKTNMAPGLSKITAEKDLITSEKSIEMKTLERVYAEIEDSKLTITNIGNVPYDKSIELEIAGQKIVEKIKLGIGQSKIYKLSAPDGIYEIKLSDDSNIMSRSGVALTGNAVSFQEAGARLDQIFTNYPIVWIFIAVVLASGLYVWYHKRQSNKKLGVISASKTQKMKAEQIKKQGGFEIVKPQAVIDKIIAGEGIRKAEQVVVLHGQKQPASIVAIKIKNEISGISKNDLTAALEYGYKNRAVSYSSGDSIILIFSPLLTKTIKNEDNAIKTAMDIDGFLKDHNRKYRNDKIVYGIGVNTGELINKIEGKILQFTSISKTISHAKKIAELADETVLLSKEIHEKTPSVKTERFSAGNMDLFTIKRVVNTEASQQFINEFLRRNQNQK